MGLIFYNQGEEQLRAGELKVKKYIRLLFYGGARTMGDNGAFHYASKNVRKDYDKDSAMHKIIRKFVDTAKSIVDDINNQEDNSIKSIDFFTHGSQYALYLIKGSSENLNISKDDVEDKNLSAALFASRTAKVITGWDLHDDARIITNIKFAKFTRDSIIEIHGCNTAADAILIDSIAKNLSEELHSAGKTDAVVIGHTTKANPNIKGGGTKDEEQDYRHGERAIIKNGKVESKTNAKGRIRIN